MRVMVASEPLDFRKGIDGTAAVCRQVLDEDPLDGAVFVFRNRAATMVRALVYDGQGFWLMTKRLSQGKYRFWCAGGQQPSRRLEPHELVTLLAGGDWTRAGAPKPWRPLPGRTSDAEKRPPGLL
jgi:transposase